MLQDMNIPEFSISQGNILTQTQFHAFVHGLETFMKFSPALIAMHGGCMMAENSDDLIVIQADYSALLPVLAPLAFAPDRGAIARLKLIQGEGDVCVRLTPDRHVLFEGDRVCIHVQAKPMPAPACFVFPIVTWLGSDFLIPASKGIKAFRFFDALRGNRLS